MNLSKKAILEKKDLENVKGGYIFYAGNHAGVRELQYEVLDDADGHVIGRYATVHEAVEMASKKAVSTQRIYWHLVEALRKTSKIS